MAVLDPPLLWVAPDLKRVLLLMRILCVAVFHQVPVPWYFNDTGNGLGMSFFTLIEGLETYVLIELRI